MFNWVQEKTVLDDVGKKDAQPIKNASSSYLQELAN